MHERPTVVRRNAQPGTLLGGHSAQDGYCKATMTKTACERGSGNEQAECDSMKEMEG